MTPLCQRGEASCGLCCGLYNRADHGRDALAALLTRRTRAFSGLPRSPESFGAAAATLSGGEEPPLFPSVRVCPLLGWLDEARTRVGCLGHPAATGGADLRDCGAYDAGTCQAFFCPSHSWLSEEEADLVARTCADSHLYGLVVTDVPFLRAVLEAVAALSGERVRVRHLASEPFRTELRRLFDLKSELEPGSEGLYGAFRPGPDGGEVQRRIDYEALGRTRSPYDIILLCMGADPRSGNDLDRLEAEVRQRLDACARALPSDP